MRPIVTLFALCCFHFFDIALGQKLPMPKLLEDSYVKEQRSPDGKPGVKYWQNKGKYKINITVKPPSKKIEGYETITYYNNSPDVLEKIGLKLILNVHKPGAPRAFGSESEKLSKGIQIHNISIDGKKADWKNEEDVFTSTMIPLPRKLIPGDSVKLNINWQYDISPAIDSREGSLNPTSFILAYFYPKIAVYDDYQGWDQMQFVDLQEFYSDFNDYEVSINVPKNFIVLGTGDFLNPSENLSQQALLKYNKSYNTESVINIATAAEMKSGKITRQKILNTWRFSSQNIADVAYLITDRYNWDASSMSLKAVNGKNISVQSAYPNEAKDFKQMVGFTKNTISWLHSYLPKLNFPFEKMTVFQGTYGMEYPMMANVETDEDPNFTRYVAEHEIAHMYLPFMAGINETRYGFMDEGWATFAETLLTRYDLQNKKAADSMIYKYRINKWMKAKNGLFNIPIITPSDVLTGDLVRVNQYGKTALGFLVLQDLLSPDVFADCLQEFLLRWKGKHPTPWDMFNSFNDISHQDLNWFWHRWFFTGNYADIGVSKIERSGNNNTIHLTNKGGMPLSGDLKIKYSDNTEEVIHFKADLWKEDPDHGKIVKESGILIHSISVIPELSADANMEDNQLENK
ncbi:M1 family metallopeptidase [Chryseobacterium sp. Tr-659]|uniref:M1 family metallopeptidase n=1 Tax=Chryseobacterium sp. Tr-659 TaxID=2608340 RepID=UPI00141E4504|nr:M1 family metallopeptidase [Chryseobacterium sp. Tr-659]NIF05109.1 M1 family metallopeptidase [Chryseobacterium sp. Tr-659]